MRWMRVPDPPLAPVCPLQLVNMAALILKLPNLLGLRLFPQ